MAKLIVGKKCLKEYTLRIIGNDANYPFNEVAAEIEMCLNQVGTFCIKKDTVPIRVHIFSANKPIKPYKLMKVDKEAIGKLAEEIINDKT